MSKPSCWSMATAWLAAKSVMLSLAPDCGAYTCVANGDGADYGRPELQGQLPR